MQFTALSAMRSITFLVGNAGRALACGAAFALVAGAGLVAADEGEDERATIYQWTDADGTHRYTPDLDRVPGSARDTVVTILATDEDPGDTPIYFEPDPRASEVAVPEPTGAADSETTDGKATDLPPATMEPGEKSDRISELEAQIAQYEAALKEFISEPGNDGATALTPELREMAAQLPGLQAELASLQRRRDGAGAGVP